MLEPQDFLYGLSGASGADLDAAVCIQPEEKILLDGCLCVKKKIIKIFSGIFDAIL